MLFVKKKKKKEKGGGKERAAPRGGIQHALEREIFLRGGEGKGGD